MKKQSKRKGFLYFFFPKISLKMKFSLLFFTITMFQLQAETGYGQKTMINLTMENTSILDVFDAIESKTDFTFFYSEDDLNLNKIVSIKAKKKKIDYILRTILTDVDVSYKVVDSYIVITPSKNQNKDFKKSHLPSNSQDRINITGKTTDVNGVPLPGATIIVEGTSTGVQTDFDGSYEITVDQGAILVYNYIGYKTLKRTATSTGVIDVQMESAVENLDKVVVVAYGTSTQRKNVGSVATVKQEDIAERPLTNFTNALSGTVAGLQTFSASGEPGASEDIVIRGVGTARIGSGSSAPLYVIDGFPFDLDTDAGSAFGDFDPLSSIDPSNIENITVLKDASATALYGSRAANGVILITTKKGKGKKPTFNLRVQQGIVTSAVPLSDTVDRETYYEVAWRGIKNRQVTGGNSEQEAATFATNNLINELGYNIYNVPNDQLVDTNGIFNPNAQLRVNENELDWWDASTPFATRINYGFDVSASSDKSDYFISAGYTKDQGFIIDSELERFNARINVNAQATNWLKIGLNLNASHTINGARGATSTQGPLIFARSIAPIYPIYLLDENGNRVLDQVGEPIFDIGAEELNRDNSVRFPDAFGLRSSQRGFSAGLNTLQTATLNNAKSTTSIISARSYFDFTLLKGLNFKTGFSADLYNTRDQTFFFSRLLEERQATRRYATTRTLTFNQLLTYAKNINNHNFNILVGHESFETKFENLFTRKENQVIDGNIEFSNFVPEALEDLENLRFRFAISSGLDEQSIESYFSRFNYDYKNKYLVSASYRADGTSILSRDVRWGDFYSVGLGWNISSEKFMSNLKWINFLKLRGSIGTAGNIAGLDSYASQATYARGGNNIDLGYVPATPGALNLVWEGQETIDVALEFNLLGNRISGSVEYYNKTSDDLIFGVPFAPSLGTPRPSIFTETAIIELNIGEVVNSGIEVQLQADIIRSKDFTWNVNANASTTKTEVTKLARQEPVDLGTRRLTEGRDLFEWYIRDYAGVNPVNGDALYRGLRDPDSYNENRDIIVANDTLTPNASAAQRYRTGKNQTPDVFGGVTNTFKYKNFSLTALMTYQVGGYIANNNRRFLLNPTIGQNAHEDILNAWQKPGDITDIPRYDLTPSHIANVTRISDRWLISNTSMALRRVTLDWQFPSKIMQNIGMSAANIYITGENLAFFSAQKGIGGNIRGSQGLTSFTPGRLISLGLNLKF